MMADQKHKTYSELIRYKTFMERFEYLKLSGQVSEETFGLERHLNQTLYRSPEWKKVRRDILIRDNGCDLGIEGREIFNQPIIHHINPITINDILERNECLFDPENLITVSKMTHNAIHYGDSNLMRMDIQERRPNDTCPWKSQTASSVQ